MAGSVAKAIEGGAADDAAKRLADDARKEEERRDVEATWEELTDADAMTLDEAVDALRKVLPFRQPLEIQELFEAGLKVPNGRVGKMMALFQAVFTKEGGEDPGQRLDLIAEKYKFYLAACAQINDGYQPAALIALEHLVGVLLPTRVKEVALVMKVLYEYDMVSDDVFDQWNESAAMMVKFKIPKEVSATVREAAQPFLDMIADSEDESSSDEE